MPRSTTTRTALTLDRLTALSDGVFAIVVTILVLDLDVPQAHDFSEGGVLTFLGRIEHQLLPYIASFTLTAAYWVLHHVMLNFVTRCDRTFVWLNLLFLLPLTLAPYVTAMRSEYPGEAAVAAIFGGVQLSNLLLLLAIWHYGLRNLTSSPVVSSVIRGMDRRLLFAGALNITGVLLVPLNERIAALAMISVPLIFIRHTVVDSSAAAE